MSQSTLHTENSLNMQVWHSFWDLLGVVHPTTVLSKSMLYSDHQEKLDGHKEKLHSSKFLLKPQGRLGHFSIQHFPSCFNEIRQG